MWRFDPFMSGDSELIELADADLRYFPRWVDADLADGWLSELSTQTPWSQPQIKLYGRSIAVPRLVAWYGDADAHYRYSGFTHEPLAWTPLLADIRQRVQQQVGQRLNGVLLNYYRDGQDAMGWHSDDERELGQQPLVVSLNLGATRRFDFRRKGASRIEYSISLEHGSLLVMSGLTQHYWQHQIARTRKVRAPRLNLTFRQIIHGPTL
ncbi:MAG TPA: alpha-ketoglutarate-dependent dioxygenase AlkB [Pseudomonas sp.]|nr:alpha-ketoglutarate-dependent dioxygenase AlkB [Stutzerimonas xanthomarina]MBU0811922.1 alpha-ketoglutarate-dependent dioxygenase AlkB [Gammaproteobacteria bacterium]HAQ87230.1 alpha-ketoglutarate-dependent dioxygenase AlkB [Pseudomonas sp.]MBU0853887.1 alpha-ketoglutarate-dependent dioxygenase AlkB [Gammaproteobacteria bacterium]MBU1302797.1 alpha-ketoglutarate-dependent dioxygenase AlkB [Gammaproteobacteria bacterium]